MKKIAWFLLALLLCGCAREPARPTTVPTTVPTTLPVETTAVPETTEETTPPETEPQPEVFTLTFVGDCTLGSNPPGFYVDYGFIKTIGEDYDYPFRNVIDYFQNDDATFANLEGPLLDKGYPTKTGHVFKGPTDYVNILLQGSIQVVSLANNHILDFGQKGYDSTVATLESHGIPYIQRDTATLVELDCGLTVGLYGSVYYKYDQEDMETQIAALRQQGADLVIYAPHWGIEMTYSPNATQVRLGHAAIDAGADIVWGSHPHVLQPIEEYGDGVIYYSMGNFSFGGNGDPGDYDTVIIQQQVVRDSDGTVTLGERTLIPCSVSSIPKRNNFQPTPYPEGSEEYNRVLKKLGVLTE